MKSVLFYEALDETNPQTNTILGTKEIFEKLEEICREKWGGYKDWTFEKWWNRCNEDLWLYIKEDPEEVLVETKIVTSLFWYEKNHGVGKIYENMSTLCEQFIEKWHEDHPEPEVVEEELLDEEEVLGSILERMEADYL